MTRAVSEASTVTAPTMPKAGPEGMPRRKIHDPQDAGRNGRHRSAAHGLADRAGQDVAAVGGGGLAGGEAAMIRAGRVENVSAVPAVIVAAPTMMAHGYWLSMIRRTYPTAMTAVPNARRPLGPTRRTCARRPGRG